MIIYETAIAALLADLLANADIELVNYLAARMAGLDGKEFDALGAIIESPYRFFKVEQIIEYAYNLDSFHVHPVL